MSREGAEEEAVLFEGLALLRKGRAAADAAAGASSEAIRRAATRKASTHHKKGFALINSVVMPGSPSSRALRRRLSEYRPTGEGDDFLKLQQAAQRQVAQEELAVDRQEDLLQPPVLGVRAAA